VRRGARTIKRSRVDTWRGEQARALMDGPSRVTCRGERETAYYRGEPAANYRRPRQVIDRTTAKVGGTS
jgi:hypothetical protein